MAQAQRQLAVITGASSGIGLELAKLCAQNNYDIIFAADEKIEEGESELYGLGAAITSVDEDLSATEGVDALVSAVEADGRPIAALLANAGHGLGRAFLDQNFSEIRHVIDTNVTGTIYLLHQLAPKMVRAGAGRILMTGSIAGHMPGAFQAVYNGTKAFVDSFAIALRNELKDTGVTVTCLLPGATETGFFERADMADTQVAQSKKDDPADVAKTGFEAMLRGEASVVHGLKNKVQVAAGDLMPDTALAEQHRKMAEPGSGDHKN
jgi:short-subunit dehydrogenase